jgi:hypothetical protein
MRGLTAKMPWKTMGATARPTSAAAHAERRLLIGVLVLVRIGIAEAGATQCLTATGRAALHAAARVMDAPRRGMAVPAGKVDDPRPGLLLFAPTDGLEEPVTDGDRVGQATGRRLHFGFALRADGHDGSFSGLHGDARAAL